MRLWAEELRLGTMELLLTMPVAPWQAILGKFLASWLFLCIALALTFPLVINRSVSRAPRLWPNRLRVYRQLFWPEHFFDRVAHLSADAESGCRLYPGCDDLSSPNSLWMAADNRSTIGVGPQLGWLMRSPPSG